VGELLAMAMARGTGARHVDATRASVKLARKKSKARKDALAKSRKKP
jgi:hypothetical protein